MATKLGAIFLRCAIGPVSYAGGCILGRRVPEGLRELAVENLEAGLRRGIFETAQRAGVRVQDVEALLPMAELRATAQRLASSQPRAMTAWGTHAGQIGGTLTGVAELTVDGRLPDVSMFVARLAKRFSRDPQLSEPLRALSDDMASWQDLIERCTDLLGDGGTIAKAERRRRLTRVFVVGAGVMVLAIVGGAGLWLFAGRARVDAALAGDDPCAVGVIEGSDRLRASSAQRKRVDELAAACAAKRALEEKAREEARLREERAREEERARKAREAACDGLAARVESGQLLPEDQAVAGAKAALLDRIGRGALQPSDYGPADPELPCRDTPAGAKITTAFARAILASPLAWAYSDDLSPEVQSLLVARSALLPEIGRLTLARRAEESAKSALLSGNPVKMAQAKKLCALKASLDIGGGQACVGLLALVAATAAPSGAPSSAPSPP
jgi:hypothetical protein